MYVKNNNNNNLKKSCNTLNSRILSVWHSNCKKDVLEPCYGWHCSQRTRWRFLCQSAALSFHQGPKSQNSGFKWELMTNLYKYAHYFNTFGKRRWIPHLWDSDESSLKFILRNAAQSIDHALPLIALMCFSPGFIPNGPEIALACCALCPLE